MKAELKFYCDNARHLVCMPYSVENLHTMARELNVKRCWYHACRHPHYDVPKRRVAEITAKCTLVSGREILAICKGDKFSTVSLYTPSRRYNIKV